MLGICNRLALKKEEVDGHLFKLEESYSHRLWYLQWIYHEQIKALLQQSFQNGFP